MEAHFACRGFTDFRHGVRTGERREQCFTTTLRLHCILNPANCTFFVNPKGNAVPWDCNASETLQLLLRYEITSGQRPGMLIEMSVNCRLKMQERNDTRDDEDQELIKYSGTGSTFIGHVICWCGWGLVWKSWCSYWEMKCLMYLTMWEQRAEVKLEHFKTEQQ